MFLDPILANGFQYALSNASLAGIIVCTALLLLSSFSWAVMISKLAVNRRMNRETACFLELFRESGQPAEIYEEGDRFSRSPEFHVYFNACEELAYQLSGEERKGLGPKLPGRKIAPSQMQSVNIAMERAVGECVLRLEDKTSILATAVSGAPFLGLLGTVWGVMDTFSGVAAATGTATLKDMAPGVSSALVTTVVGLLVAIPAMFGYNMIVNQIKAAVISMETFGAELQLALEKAFVLHPDQRAAQGTAVPLTRAPHHPGPGISPQLAPAPSPYADPHQTGAALRNRTTGMD